MTRDETLEQLAPDFLKSRRREKRWIFGLAAVAIIALVGAAVAVVAEVSTIHTETRVTKIEKSACAQVAEHPNAVPLEVRNECEGIRQSIAKSEALAGPCILHQRATGTKGANCPKVYVPLSGKPSPGGDASTPSTGHSQPAPPSGGAPGHGGSVAPHGPHGPVKLPETPSSPPSQTGPEQETSAPPVSGSATPTHPIRSTVEQVGSTVQETGKTAGEAVGKVTCTATSLLHPCP